MTRLVLWDLDGTLVDSRRDIAVGANAGLRAVGLPERPIEEIGTFVGHGARKLMEKAVGPAHLDRLDGALQAYLAYYAAHLTDHSVLYPGVKAALDALVARRVAMVVITNKAGALARPILANLGVAGHFQAVDGQGDSPAQKPDPQGALRLCSRFGASPSQALFVGDTKIDAETARNAGIPFIGVTWGFGAEAELTVPGSPQTTIVRTGEALAQALEHA
jgi:phosphoglycolate phosphatase